ncbi:hypothetical protein [Ligilactobacillus cholophilus]|uniref:hypothetical protein n=1 Tax=Ligilactobacillus cholophilus TaxID=3050131 RepID=UPI0025B19215|nr:hypothetical protein [Ligilactobacillus cholophilus]
MLFEKNAITQLHLNLDELEKQDYYLLMEILGIPDNPSNEVIEDPRALLNL